MVVEAEEYGPVSVPDNLDLMECLDPREDWVQPEKGIHRDALKRVYDLLDLMSDPEADPADLTEEEEGTYRFNLKAREIEEILSPGGRSPVDLSEHKEAMRQLEEVYEQTIRAESTQDLTAYSI